jgi:hypothetical protein
MGKARIAWRSSSLGDEYRTRVGEADHQPPNRPQKEWQYIQVVQSRSGSRLIGVTINVSGGDPESVPDVVGAHTAYVERTNLTAPDEGATRAENPVVFQCGYGGRQ